MSRPFGREPEDTIKKLLEFQEKVGSRVPSTTRFELALNQLIEDSPALMVDLSELRDLRALKSKLEKVTRETYGTTDLNELPNIMLKQAGIKILHRLEDHGGVDKKLSPAQEELSRLKDRLTILTGEPDIDRAIDKLASKWIPGETPAATVQLNTPTDLPGTL